MGLSVYNRGDRLGYQKHPNTVCLVIRNSGDNQESPQTGLTVFLRICNSENKSGYQEYSNYIEHESGFIPTPKISTASQDTK